MSDKDIEALNEQLRRAQAEYDALPKNACGHPVEETDDYGCGMCCHEAIMKRNAPFLRRYLDARRKKAE